MESLRKALKGMGYFLGTIIPNITFLIIFGTFMLTIVSRYILKAPVTWSYEVSILAYIWTMFFGVGKAMSVDEHVVFGLVYDHVSPKTRAVFRIIGDALIIVLLLIVFVPSVRSMLSKRMVTGVLKLPFSAVFAPLLFMFADIIYRSVVDLVKVIRHGTEAPQQEVEAATAKEIQR